MLPSIDRSDANCITSSKCYEASAIELRRSIALPVLLDFFADRLKVQQREAGVRHDLIDAVFALGGEDDLVRLLARVHALQSFVGTEDGANLLAGYKRAANILKKEGYDSSPLGERAGARGGEGAPTAPRPSASAAPSPNGRGNHFPTRPKPQRLP